MKYTARTPVTVDALTFEEFVEHGRTAATSLVGGVPWSFKWNGYHATHETDDHYLVGGIDFRRGEVLVVFEDAVGVMPADQFAQQFVPVESKD